MLIGFQPEVYEAINLVIAGFCLFMVIIFARYLITEWLSGHLVLSLRPFDGLLRHQMATAILVTMAGEGALRGWTWLVRFQDRQGYPIEWMEHWPAAAVPAAAGAVQVVGLLCLIRVLTPDDWTRWTWVAVLLIAFVTLVATFVV